MRRLSKAEVRAGIFFFAGLVFILLSCLMALSAIMASGSGFQIAVLFALGIGFAVYGWKAWKIARSDY